jgi:hypothetical protein
MRNYRLYKSRRLLTLGSVLLLLSITCFTCLKHPILLKWLSGSARQLGRPIHSVVYRNGAVDKKVKLFHVNYYWGGEPADYYLLYFTDSKNSRLKVISLNRKDIYAGVSAATNIRDYDLVGGVLFQSEVGSNFMTFQHDLKGFNYDPEIRFEGKKILLNVPSEAGLNRDSLRVSFQ